MTARNIKSEIPDAQIIIIDQKDYFEYTPGILRALVNPSHLPMLHARMTDVVTSPSLLQQGCGWWPSAATVTALWPKHPQSAAASSGISFVWGEVQFVDTEARLVQVAPCAPPPAGESPPPQLELQYDYLVLATGSGYAAPMKPSALENSHAARVAAVAATHSRLQFLAQRPSQTAHVLVVGGGAVGVEMVGELITHFPSLKVTLVSSSPRLLAEQTEAVSTAALQWCAQHNVQVLLGTRASRQPTGPSPHADATGQVSRARSKSRKGAAPAASATAAGQPQPPSSMTAAASAHVMDMTRGGDFALSTGGSLAVDMVFTCVGFTPNSTPLAPPSSPLRACLSPSKQIQVNDQLQAHLPADSASHGRVYSAGDVSLHLGTRELKLAHTAEMMAHTAAANIAADMAPVAAVGTFASVLAALWGFLLLVLRACGAAAACGPTTHQLHTYPGHITGFKGWPVPRVMCVSLGPHEAILIMNGLSLTSYPGRVASAWAKWVIETSKMWATRDLAIGHAIWAFGDAAAVAVSNFLVMPLGQNQPAAGAHRVSCAAAAPGTAAPARLLWSGWVCIISTAASVLRAVLPGVFVAAAAAAGDRGSELPQTTASF